MARMPSMQHEQHVDRQCKEEYKTHLKYLKVLDDACNYEVHK